MTKYIYFLPTTSIDNQKKRVTRIVRRAPTPAVLVHVKQRLALEFDDLKKRSCKQSMSNKSQQCWMVVHQHDPVMLVDVEPTWLSNWTCIMFIRFRLNWPLLDSSRLQSKRYILHFTIQRLYFLIIRIPLCRNSSIISSLFQRFTLVWHWALGIMLCF